MQVLGQTEKEIFAECATHWPLQQSHLLPRRVANSSYGPTRISVKSSARSAALPPAVPWTFLQSLTAKTLQMGPESSLGCVRKVREVERTMLWISENGRIKFEIYPFNFLTTEN